MQLLDQVIKRQLVISASLILLSIPSSYYFLNKLILDETQQSLVVKQQRLFNKMEVLTNQDELNHFFRMKDNLVMHEIPPDSVDRDTLYKASEYDSFSKENIPTLVHRFAVKRWGHQYQIFQKESLINENELIILVLKVQVTLMLILIIILLWVNYRYSKATWKPFYTTLKQLQQFELDKDDDLVLPSSKIKEFNDLNITIQALAEKSSQAYKAQKEFTENAAHELQTPLAIFQSKLEVIMQQEHLTAEDAALIHSLTEVGDRLSRISKGLLLLTKIDNNQFIGKEAIQLSCFVKDLLSSFEQQLEDNEISCHVETSDNTILANSNLIDILLSNLISNAIRYNIRQGHIWIGIADYKVVITNTGDNIPISIERMYGRFTKSSKHPQSIGLGLAIVRKICDVCKYSLDYNYEERLHTFTISFKE
jgi:signal transduction histidine kinase